MKILLLLITQNVGGVENDFIIIANILQIRQIIITQ